MTRRALLNELRTISFLLILMPLMLPGIVAGFIGMLIGHGWNLGCELYRAWFWSMKP